MVLGREFGLHRSHVTIMPRLRARSHYLSPMELLSVSSPTSSVMVEEFLGQLVTGVFKQLVAGLLLLQVSWLQLLA